MLKGKGEPNMNLIQKWYWHYLFTKWMNKLQMICYFRDLHLDRRGLWINCWHNGSGPWYELIGGNYREQLWERIEYLRKKEGQT